MTRVLQAVLVAVVALLAGTVALTAAGPAAAAQAGPPPASAVSAVSAVSATDEEPAGESVVVRVRVDETRERLAGVDVRVLQAGATVAEGTTDDDGSVTLPVPEPGDYEVELVTESLPEQAADLVLEQNPFPTTVEPGTPRTVALRLLSPDAATGDSEADDGIAWSTTPQLAVQGLRFGLVLALAAIGLSLVFGTTGLTNFSHGELVTFGALTTYGIHVVGGVPLLAAIPLMLLLAIGFGWLQDTAIWGRLRSRGVGLIAMMIFSIGFSFFLRYSYLYLFGGQTVFYRDFSGQQGLELGPVRVRPLDLISMGVAVAILLLVAFALLYTRLGKATRAVSDNPALAAASGIDVDRVIRVVWISGTFLAALAGMLFGLSQGMDWLLGFQVLLLIFAAVVLGGLGTAFGAMLGAIAVGVLIEVSTLIIPAELKNVGALAVLIIILIVRPQGVLGRRERIG